MRTFVFLLLIGIATVVIVACSGARDAAVTEVAPVGEARVDIAPTPTNEPQPTAASTTDATPLATATPFVSALPNLGKAPDIRNETWLNAEPMTLSDNLGKVVLVEFWTYT